MEIDGVSLDGFEVEIGGMDYGFEIGGILGMDFLRKAGAVAPSISFVTTKPSLS